MTELEWVLLILDIMLTAVMAGIACYAIGRRAKVAAIMRGEIPAGELEDNVDDASVPGCGADAPARR